MKQNWEYKALGDVCDIICGQDYKAVLDDNGLYPIYGTGGIMGYASEYRCPANSVIIGRKGSINNPLFVDCNFWNVDTAFGMVPNKQLLEARYFFYFCRNYDFTRHNVAVTIPSLRRIDLIKIPVPIPPLDEQQRIVAELDLLTEVIDKQKTQLKELDTLAQSIFYDMFGDPIENEKGWDIRPLERVVDATCTLSYGIVQTGDDVEDGVPVVRPIDMYSTYVTSLGLKKTTKEISDSYKRTVLKGSELLLCIRGATGIVAMASIDLNGCNVGRNIVPISFSSCVIRDFAYYVFKTKSMFQEIQNKTHGIALQGINVKDVRLLPIILPPLALQQEFADKIQSIEKQKAAINQSIADTQKLLDYTMDKYFG